MAKKIITVVGATGNQGAGIIAELLKHPNKYEVRATTRRPTSDSANSLRAKGIEIAQADLNDLESLKAAFAGSHVIFAVTDFFEPFAKSGPANAMIVEEQQGINLARAAAATKSLEHFIWSTLPNSRRITNGKYVVPHFEAKNQVDAFIRGEPELLAKTTFLWVTWFHSNYSFPMFTPYFIPTAGKYVQFADYGENTLISTIGDVRSNVGVFADAIVENPEKTSNGAIVVAEIATHTAAELLQFWAKAQGVEATIIETDEESFNKLWPMWAEEMGGMMRFWDEYGLRSWSDAGKTIVTKEDLGIDTSRFVDIKESFKALKY